MVPKLGPCICLVLFLTVFIIFVDSQYIRFSDYANHEHSFNTSHIFEKASLTNKSIQMRFRSTDPVYYEFVKCNQPLIGTRKNVTSDIVVFNIEWINWMLNKTCPESITNEVELKVYIVIPTSGRFNFSLRHLQPSSNAVLEHGLHFVNAESNQTVIFNSSIAALFKQDDATKGNRYRLVTDMTNNATVTFGKCNYELHKHFHLQKNHDIILEQEDLENIYQISNIYCPTNNQSNSFDIHLQSAGNVTGALTILIVDEDQIFHESLIEILVFLVCVGFVVSVVVWRGKPDWTFYSFELDNKRHENYEMMGMDDDLPPTP